MSNQSINPAINQSMAQFTPLYPLYQTINTELLTLNTAKSIAELAEKGASIKRLINQLQSSYQSIVERESCQFTSSDQSNNQSSDSSLQPSSFFPSSNKSSSPSSSPSNNQSNNQSFAVQSLLHSQLIDSYPSRLREQLMIAKAKIGSNASNIRRELIQSNNQPNHQSGNQLTDRRKLDAQFRSSLSHTTNLLTSSLELSASSLSNLRASTERVRNIDHQSSVYKSTLNVGARVVTAQQQRHRTDRIIIALGCLFFASVCMYILNKRMRMAKIATFLFNCVHSLVSIFIPNWSSSSKPLNEQTEYQFQQIQ